MKPTELQEDFLYEEWQYSKYMQRVLVYIMLIIQQTKVLAF